MSDEVHSVQQKIDIELMKKDIKLIIDNLSNIASLKENLILIQDEVQGNKKFKNEFDKNVEIIVTREIKSSKNLLSLQSISDKQIEQYIKSSEFTNLIHKMCETKINILINDEKSSTYSNIIEIISNWVMKKERVIIFKVVGFIVGSFSLIFAIYKYIQ